MNFFLTCTSQKQIIYSLLVKKYSMIYNILEGQFRTAPA